MRLSRIITRRGVIAASLVFVIFALTIWTIRPSPYFQWLGATGLGQETPLSLIRGWADERLAPRTPIGLVSLFPPADLLIAVALLTALSILLMLLPAAWREERTGPSSTNHVHALGLPRVRLRLRTSLVLIAILGLDLGWEIGAWRTWRLRHQYLREAAVYTDHQANYAESLRRVERGLAAIETGAYVPLEDDCRTASARAADTAYRRDQLRRESSHLSALVAAYGRLRRKYERAAADPLRPVPPDPPLPEPPPETGDWPLRRGFDESLAGFEELIRLYPDLVWAHERRAWILATCPDARLRGGKLAVASALRAGELTNWKEGHVLSTLAAAYAETGDFANAVCWEQQAAERLAAAGIHNLDQDRLALYKAGEAASHERPISGHGRDVGDELAGASLERQ